MNKKQLVDAISRNAGISQSEANLTLNALIEAVTEELKSGGCVALSGFGTFQIKERTARSGRNPATGQTIEIPAARMPIFKAGKALKEMVNQYL